MDFTAEHEALITKIRTGTAEDARQSLIGLLDYMNDPDRLMTPGSCLYDSFIRDIIADYYSGDTPG